jgi:hypothetical protein
MKAVSVKCIFLICAVLALVAGGCHKPLDRQAAGVDVVVEGNKTFPGDIAGRWKADEDGWEFVFSPDGRILSAAISLGRVRVIPGQITTVPTRSGDQAVFTPGPWTVDYAPDSNQLTVKIAMSHVRVEMAGNTIEGSSTDIFAGGIHPAEGTWRTLWTTFTKYTGHTPDKPSFDLSTDPTYGETKPLTFRKVADQ